MQTSAKNKLLPSITKEVFYMTVKELIDKLKEYPENNTVTVEVNSNSFEVKNVGCETVYDKERGLETRVYLIYK